MLLKTWFVVSCVLVAAVKAQDPFFPGIPPANIGNNNQGNSQDSGQMGGGAQDPTNNTDLGNAQDPIFPGILPANIGKNLVNPKSSDAQGSVVPTTPTKSNTAKNPSQGCRAGYKKSVTGDCIDVDECVTQPCGLGWCSNNAGSYTCSCLAGAKFNDSNVCVDIDECLDPLACVGGKCHNLIGGYECLCNPGYKFNQTTKSCEDLNECTTKLNLCHVNADCHNSIGGYECQCKKYFYGDGFFDCELSPEAAASFHIKCQPSLMQLDVDGWVIATYGPMTLRNTECTGVGDRAKGKTTWRYSIVDDLSNCNNTVFNNGSHVIYSNVLTNNKSVIAKDFMSGAIFQAEWTCTFKTKNIHSSLSTELLNGTGFIHFQLGQPNEQGLYPKTIKGIRKSKYGDVVDGSSSADPSSYGGKKPVGTTDSKNATVIEGPHLPGEPHMSMKYPNGTVRQQNLTAVQRKDLKGVLQKNSRGVDVNKKIVNTFYGLNGTGVYLVKILPFTDDTFLYIQKKKVFSSKDMLYLRVALLTKDYRLATVIQRCWGTPKADPLSRPSVDLIVDGCAVPYILQNSVKIYRNGVARTADFQTQVFKFNYDNSTYIHCTVDICDKEVENCQPSCQKDLQRRKRSAPGVMQTSQRRNLTLHFGPYHVKDEEIQAPSTPSNQPLVISLSVAVAILALLATALCCCVMCARKRRRKRNQKVRGLPLTAENNEA